MNKESPLATYPSVYTTPTNILSRPIADMMTYPMDTPRYPFRLGKLSWIGLMFIIMGLIWEVVGNNKDL